MYELAHTDRRTDGHGSWHSGFCYEADSHKKCFLRYWNSLVTRLFSYSLKSWTSDKKQVSVSRVQRFWRLHFFNCFFCVCYLFFLKMNWLTTFCRHATCACTVTSKRFVLGPRQYLTCACMDHCSADIRSCRIVVEIACFDLIKAFCSVKIYHGIALVRFLVFSIGSTLVIAN